MVLPFLILDLSGGYQLITTIFDPRPPQLKLLAAPSVHQHIALRPEWQVHCAQGVEVLEVFLLITWKSKVTFLSHLWLLGHKRPEPQLIPSAADSDPCVESAPAPKMLQARGFARWEHVSRSTPNRFRLANARSATKAPPRNPEAFDELPVEPERLATIGWPRYSVGQNHPGWNRRITASGCCTCQPHNWWRLVVPSSNPHRL